MQINAYSPSKKFASNISMTSSKTMKPTNDDADRKPKKRMFIAAITLSTLLAATGFGIKGNNRKIIDINKQNPIVELMSNTQEKFMQNIKSEGFLRNF